MPLVVGVMALLGGLSELEIAIRCTSAAQQLTLQELLDGKAGENRYIEITDFRPYGRYVTKPGKGGSLLKVYIGVLPAHSKTEAPDAPRAIIMDPIGLPDWSERKTIRGILWNPRRLSEADKRLLQEIYPAIDVTSCHVLQDGREPTPLPEVIGNYFVIGVLGLVLGGWMLYPGRTVHDGKCMSGAKTREQAGGPSMEAIVHSGPHLPARQVFVEEARAAPGSGSDLTPNAPLLARILAVAYVLSLAVQPIGFFLLAGIGCFLWVRHGLNGWVWGIWLGSIGCLAFCSAFRWWVRRWGHRRWANAEDQLNGCH